MRSKIHFMAEKKMTLMKYNNCGIGDVEKRVGGYFMRFEENRINQFFSTQKTITSAEKNEMMDEFDIRGRQALSAIGEDIKAGFKGERPSDGDDSKKGPSSLLILVVFFAVAIGVIVTGFINLMISGIIFFLGFAFFGFYLFATSRDGQATDSVNGTTTEGNRSTPLVLGLIGLCGAVPLCFYKSVGFAGAAVLTGVALFASVGVMFLFSVITNKYNKKHKYIEEVNADCIGYLRTIDTYSDIDNHMSHLFRTSPVFEYTYQGEKYTGVYDLMINGTAADIDIGRTTILIDPNHPTDIGRKPSKSSNNIINVLLSLLSIALAFALLVYFFNHDFAFENKVHELNLPAFGMKYMNASDEEKRNMAEDLFNQFDEITPDYTYPAEITDAFVNEMAPGYIKEKDWYYEITTVTAVNEYENNYTDDDGAQVHSISKSYDFASDDIPFVGTNEGDGYQEGDKAIVFYTIDTYEFDGKTYSNKMIFLNMKADGHTYTGSLKAYEEGN